MILLVKMPRTLRNAAGILQFHLARVPAWVLWTVASAVIALTLLAEIFSVDQVFGDMAHWPLRASVWGTTGQWAGSLITGASFYLAYRVYKGTVDRERRAQAQLVTFDCIIGPHTYRGTVYNHSKAIIRDVHLAISRRSEGAVDRRKPGFTRVTLVNDEDAKNKKLIGGLIAPIAETEYDSIRPDVEQRFNSSGVQLGGNSDQYEVWLVFTDAAGVDWIRYQDDGKLEEICYN
ncbi:hypothetical protein [Rhodococcus koreensis]